MTATTPVDVDALPPTQYMMLEVLAARHRLGEHLWTFPTRFRAAADQLAKLGLVGWQAGVAPKTIQVWLTDAGRTAVLSDSYQPPEPVAPPSSGPDLRHLAVILNAGKQAAEQMRDPVLTHSLSHMTEVAVQLHLNPTGTLFNLDRDFNAIADRLT